MLHAVVPGKDARSRNSATMNGDKLSTLHYLFTLAMQHSGIWLGTGLMPSNAKAAQRNDRLMN